MKIPVVIKNLIQKRLISLDKYTRDATALAAVMDFSINDIYQVQQHPERIIPSGPHIVNWYVQQIIYYKKEECIKDF
jgi:hypothetical protein